MLESIADNESSFFTYLAKKIKIEIVIAIFGFSKKVFSNEYKQAFH